MPRQDHNQTIGPDGQIISEEIVETPERVIGEAEFQQAKQTLRTMVGQFWDGSTGQPTGTPTANQMRNWLLALTLCVRYLAGEKENEQ